jgi:hypothetical protein
MNESLLFEQLTGAAAKTAEAVLKKGISSAPVEPPNFINHTAALAGKTIGTFKGWLGRIGDYKTIITSASNGDVATAGGTLARMATSALPNSKPVLEKIEEAVKMLPYGEKGLENARSVLSNSKLMPIIGLGITALPLAMGKRDTQSKGEFVVSTCKTVGFFTPAGPASSEAAANICESAWKQATGVEIKLSMLSQIKDANSAISSKANETPINTFPVLPPTTPNLTKAFGSKYSIPTT